MYSYVEGCLPLQMFFLLFLRHGLLHLRKGLNISINDYNVFLFVSKELKLSPKKTTGNYFEHCVPRYLVLEFSAPPVIPSLAYSFKSKYFSFSFQILNLFTLPRITQYFKGIFFVQLSLYSKQLLPSFSLQRCPVVQISALVRRTVFSIKKYSLSVGCYPVC